jgi:NAD(P)-dependent dehydrogenase (short-subunit alcohol dehydrogenase family)
VFCHCGGRWEAVGLGEHGEVHQRSVDMSEPDAPAAFLEWAVEQLGGIDVVVSNVSAQAGNDYTASFQVDIEGANSLIRASLANMADHADANIVFIGSRAGNVGVPWMPADAAVKAATVSMGKSLALEVARRGIRVARRGACRSEATRQARVAQAGGRGRSQAMMRPVVRWRTSPC